MEKRELYEWSFEDGFIAATRFLSRGLNCLTEGSRNLLLLGAVAVQGRFIPSTQRPWRGLESKGSGTGVRKATVVGKTWGGIKDNGATEGAGSLFEDFGRALFMIGAGIPSIEGTSLTGITLSTSLQISVAVSGAYSAGNTYTAGLAQPAAPTVAVRATAGLCNGEISFKIARFRSSTGGRSRASTTSAVIAPASEEVRITFPAASTGQDFWHVFVTQAGFGGVGLHYQLAYNGSLDIPESALTTVDGNARSLALSFQDGDLFPITAYVDDFAPPAGTHAARIENAMVVLGAYADSSASVSSTSTGTAGAVSLPNYFESYRPRDLVYFPEQVVDVLGRPWDSHAYVIAKNSVSSLQYVGLRDGPAVAATSVWADIGFQYPHNVCQFFGRLAGMVARGSLVMMDGEGAPDLTWGAEVRDLIAEWEPAETKVGFHPDTLSLVVMNGGVALSYSLENRKWSPPCYFADAGVAGSALSCVTSQGELVISVNNGGAHTAYAWDAGAATMTVAAMTNWRDAPRPATIYELAAALDTDSAATPLILGAHVNLRKTFVRDASTTNSSATIGSATAGFDSNHIGDVVCVFGANVGGVGVHYLIGRIATVPGATSITIVNAATGGALTASATLTNCHLIIAHDLAAITLPRTGPQHTGPLTEFLARDALSCALSLTLITNATRGQFMNVAAWGTIAGESVSRTA